MSTLEDFPRLRDTWHAETRFLSDLTRMVQHPAYQQIIDLGPAVIPVLLTELERENDHWFWALTMLTGEDAGLGHHTVEGARQAWLAWGRERKLLRS